MKNIVALAEEIKNEFDTFLRDPSDNEFLYKMDYLPLLRYD